ACLDNSCLNGGTCTDQDGNMKCLCLPTYGGVYCETDLERCEPGWDKFHGFCYRHFSQRQSWEVAERHCRMQGAHLVSIMTPEEQDYINSRVRNASIFGKARQRYETNAVVRYHCSEGFQQRLNPLVRCLPGGRWERPQILCIPEGGEVMQNLDMSQTDSNFSAAENEIEATEETPQFRDIKF
ncbi:hypothetical protein GOODEAATRI_029789, partial [Goodea atripinnis]